MPHIAMNKIMTKDKLDLLKTLDEPGMQAYLKGKRHDDITMLAAWKRYADTDDCNMFLNTVSALGLKNNQKAIALFEHLLLAWRHDIHKGKYVGNDEVIRDIASHFDFSKFGGITGKEVRPFRDD